MEEQRKKISIIAIGTIILFIGCILTIFKTFIDYPYRLEIKNLFSSIEPIFVNMEMKKQVDANIMFCFNDYCSNLERDWNKKAYNLSFKKKNFGSNYTNKIVKKYRLAVETSKFKEFDNNIQNIFIFVGAKKYYFTKDDLKQLEKKTFKIEIENNKIQEYVAYDLSNDIKANYKGFFNHIIVFFLSIFYNWHYIPAAYLGILYSFIIYHFKREEFNFNLSFKLTNKKVILILLIIFMLALMLRLNQFVANPYFVDELYTVNIAIKDFISCFKDPGNPPLFFIFEYLISKISTTMFAFRFLPLCFSMGFCGIVYYLFKKIDRNFALLMCFLASINTISINYSQAARSCSLCILLILLTTYFLFEYLNKKNKKNLILYSIFTMFSCNSHYLLILQSFFNFIYGSVVLFQTKHKKELIKFNICNLIALITIAPYLLISFKQALTGDFNSWIPKFTFNTIDNIISYFFVNKILLSIFVVFVLLNLVFAYLPKKYLNKFNISINDKSKQYLLYSLFSLLFVLISSIIISITIKPMLASRHLTVCYGMFFLLIGAMIHGVVDFNKTTRFTTIAKITFSSIVTFCFFSITHPDTMRIDHNIDKFVFFVENDMKKYAKKGYEIHLIIPDYEEYLKSYPTINNSDIVKHVLYANTNIVLNKIEKNKYMDIDKKAVIYFLNFAISLNYSDYETGSFYCYENEYLKNNKIVYD